MTTNSTSTKPSRDVPLTAIRVIVWGFMIAAAVISSRHIIHTAQWLGLANLEAFTVPGFVDGIAIVGKISMLPRFSDAFRRSGFRLLMFGGSLSLACNIAAGHNWGERGYGVLVCAGFMILESHATKATRHAIAKPKGRKLDPAEAQRRADKARQTRAAGQWAAMTPAQRGAATRAARRAEMADPVGTVNKLPGNAPVSPAGRPV